MNSTADDTKEILECGTSLAEDVWIVPSMTVPSSSSLSQPQVKSNYYSEFSCEAVSKSAVTTLVEEAWSKIHQLRSRLAADVISDPSSSTNSISRSNNFPTFISPFERPKLIIDDGDKTKRSTNRKSATGSNTSNNDNNKNNSGSYQGMSVPLIYCDQTASQRPVRSIEDYIRCVSMPCYANTHTVSSN